MDMIKYLKVIETWKSIVRLLYGAFATKRNIFEFGNNNPCNVLTTQQVAIDWSHIHYAKAIDKSMVIHCEKTFLT